MEIVSGLHPRNDSFQQPQQFQQLNSYLLCKWQLILEITEIRGKEKK